MIKLYKNLTGKYIKVNLYGIGEIAIPADAKAIPLEESVVRALQDMTYVKLFEEVEQVAKEDMVVTVENEDETEDETEQDDVTEIVLEELTNAVLRDMCKEQGIECSERDTKPILISKLRGE